VVIQLGCHKLDLIEASLVFQILQACPIQSLTKCECSLYIVADNFVLAAQLCAPFYLLDRFLIQICDLSQDAKTGGGSGRAA